MSVNGGLITDLRLHSSDRLSQRAADAIEALESKNAELIARLGKSGNLRADWERRATLAEEALFKLETAAIQASASGDLGALRKATVESYALRTGQTLEPDKKPDYSAAGPVVFAK